MGIMFDTLDLIASAKAGLAPTVVSAHTQLCKCDYCEVAMPRKARQPTRYPPCISHPKLFMTIQPDLVLDLGQ